MNNFEVKKKIVFAGNSRIFNDWAAHSTITMADFISALQWVCEDALDESGKLCLEKAKLIVYSHGDYLALGRKLGTFGYSVRKKKPVRRKK